MEPIKPKSLLNSCLLKSAEDDCNPGLKSCHYVNSGYSLVEVLIAIVILGILVVITYNSYSKYIDRSNNSIAYSDISAISQAIERFYVVQIRFPKDLAEINMNSKLDPWGQPYKYLNIKNGGPRTIGSARKDKFLVPINSDFDLYSMGKDGDSKPPIAAKKSRDDIIRANNGKYVGMATDF